MPGQYDRLGQPSPTEPRILAVGRRPIRLAQRRLPQPSDRLDIPQPHAEVVRRPHRPLGQPAPQRAVQPMPDMRRQHLPAREPPQRRIDVHMPKAPRPPVAGIGEAMQGGDQIGQFGLIQSADGRILGDRPEIQPEVDSIVDCPRPTIDRPDRLGQLLGYAAAGNRISGELQPVRRLGQHLVGRLPVPILPDLIEIPQRPAVRIDRLGIDDRPNLLVGRQRKFGGSRPVVAGQPAHRNARERAVLIGPSPHEPHPRDADADPRRVDRVGVSDGQQSRRTRRIVGIGRPELRRPPNSLDFGIGRDDLWRLADGSAKQRLAGNVHHIAGNRRRRADQALDAGVGKRERPTEARPDRQRPAGEGDDRLVVGEQGHRPLERDRQHPMPTARLQERLHAARHPQAVRRIAGTRIAKGREQRSFACCIKPPELRRCLLRECLRRVRRTAHDIRRAGRRRRYCQRCKNQRSPNARLRPNSVQTPSAS